MSLLSHVTCVTNVTCVTLVTNVTHVTCFTNVTPVTHVTCVTQVSSRSICSTSTSSSFWCLVNSKINFNMVDFYDILSMKFVSEIGIQDVR